MSDQLPTTALLLSPYDAMSHRYWREGIVTQFPEIDVTEVVLPPRYFSWRFRGNSLTMAHDARLGQSFDILIATSMTDLSALKGMNANIAPIPSLLYFHENQFAYPASTKKEQIAEHRIEKQMTSLYSAIAADYLAFNSLFNRDSFFEGVTAMLHRMPDHVPAGIVDALQEKTIVLPVPLGDECFCSARKKDPFSIVWNHRWEYDKGVDDLKVIVLGLLASKIEFKLHLVGQQFRSVPSVMQEIVEILRRRNCLGQLGFVQGRAEYLDLLASSHCVLSTAHHEFQGLSIQEAMASGCVPVVPDGLSYPEYVPETNRYQNPADAVELIVSIAREPDRVADQPIDSISWGQQRPAWKTLLTQLVSGN